MNETIERQDENLDSTESKELAKTESPVVFEEKEVKLEQEPTEEDGVEKEIDELKTKVDLIMDVPEKKPEPKGKEREVKIQGYQKKYLPEHLKEKGVSLISKTLSYLLTKGERFEKDGEENIPKKGPYLVICNHWGEESVVLLRTFKNADIHLAVGKEIWWDKSPLMKWFFKKMGTIPVEESLANLSGAQKAEALSRQKSSFARKVYKNIIEKEQRGDFPANTSFVRQAVALLSRGDAVSVYPEGLWIDPQGPIKEKEELKQGYRGIELIAKKFKDLTGEELPILPTAFVDDEKNGGKKIIIGKPILLSKNESGLNGTDWAMSHIAGMLPEDKRGYYKNTAIERKK